MSYIDVIARYHQHREAIHHLLASILTGIAEQRLFDQEAYQRKAIQCLRESYPFVDLLFTLDVDGLQLSENLTPSDKDAKEPTGSGRGRDRSQRPYFLLAKQTEAVAVTEPYLSTANRNLCISASAPVRNHDGQTVGFVVIDSNLSRIVEFLMGDTKRRRFAPVFKLVYGLISAGLFAVVAVLLYASFTELVGFVHPEDAGNNHLYFKPFGTIIYLTLGLAVFDLAKTTLEEEVLMHKDIFRHSATRRTITRFIAAILIAVSIEALLMMFKSSLGDGSQIQSAVLMMFSAVGLLMALGAYVYLGAKAEVTLTGIHKTGQS